MRVAWQRRREIKSDRVTSVFMILSTRDRGSYLIGSNPRASIKSNLKGRPAATKKCFLGRLRKTEAAQFMEIYGELWKGRNATHLALPPHHLNHPVACCGKKSSLVVLILAGCRPKDLITIISKRNQMKTHKEPKRRLPRWGTQKSQ